MREVPITNPTIIMGPPVKGILSVNGGSSGQGVIICTLNNTTNTKTKTRNKGWASTTRTKKPQSLWKQLYKAIISKSG